jgi:hypothetical protein
MATNLMFAGMESAKATANYTRQNAKETVPARRTKTKESWRQQH